MEFQSSEVLVPPKDINHMAYIIFFILGISVNIPWFFFVDAQKYWKYKFRNVTIDYIEDENYSSELQNYFTAYLNITSQIPYSLFLVINIFLCKWISSSLRSITTLFLVIILFIISTVFVHIDTDKWQNEFLILTLTTVAVLNAINSTFAGTIIGTVGNFPSKYISSLSQGLAVSGIFAAVFQILSLWLSTGPIETGLMYFLIGDFIIICAFILYILLEKQEFFKYHMKKKDVNIKNSNESVDDAPSSVSYVKILFKIWPYGLSMFLTYFITYFIHPGVNSLIKSESTNNTDWSNKYFVPVATFLTFSIGDYFGCLLSEYFTLLKKKPCLLLSLSIARFIFIPIFFVCNASADSVKHLPIYINNDYLYMCLMIIFSTSHGYLWSSVFILVPTVVESREQEIASAMMGGFFGLGLSTSAVISVYFIAFL